MRARVLLIDDDPGIRFGFSRYLSNTGYEVIGVPCLADAQESLSSERFDAVLLDLNLPDGNGLLWIDGLRKSQPDIAIVVITGTSDVPTAVEAMRRGADNFLTKPVDMAELDIFLKKSLEVETLRRRNSLSQRLSKDIQPFFGRSTASKSILDLAAVSAENESVVVIQGETGTGKGVLARWIHDHSRRCDGPFVAINCSSLKGDLLASELFGHARGAFTSAVQDRQGLIEVADRGTLFLDEIGDMDLSVQSHLLKVIEEKQYRRLGEVKVRKSDFRLICATNRDLMKETSQGRFREDLYFRIFVFPIVVPPLRMRVDDLPGFVQFFLAHLNASVTELTPDIMRLLESYHWPGNIRELRNILERALLLSRGGPLGIDHFQGLGNSGDSFQTRMVRTEGRKVNGFEADEIENALKAAQGDPVKAAKTLGISRATLYRRLKKVREL